MWVAINRLGDSVTVFHGFKSYEEIMEWMKLGRRSGGSWEFHISLAVPEQQV